MLQDPTNSSELLRYAGKQSADSETIMHPPENQNQLLKAVVAKENRLYLDLIRSTGCDQMTNDETSEAQAKFTGWTEYSNWMRKSYKPDQDSESDISMFKIPVWREAAVKIVHLRTSKNWNISSN